MRQTIGLGMLIAGMVMFGVALKTVAPPISPPDMVSDGFAAYAMWAGSWIIPATVGMALTSFGIRLLKNRSSPART